MKVVNKRNSAFTHYIGRPSIFGNPFVIGRDGSREDVVRKYEAWVWTQPDILRHIEALPYDAVLGCFCAPESCHGDAIVRVWEKLYAQEPVATRR